MRVTQQGDRLTIHHGATCVAEHVVSLGTRVRRVDPAHLAGISGYALFAASPTGQLSSSWAPATRDSAPAHAPSALLRPLDEYAALLAALEEQAE